MKLFHSSLFSRRNLRKSKVHKGKSVKY